ncbi:UNVERIFIED_CONTAM: putative leucine-rich repeat receptor-like protein kinase [Sesamum latifolium]|uniref:Leucine-rich repeat receptor-like protein kinase n=1 Tax=Sesamum latifolium TaxID=2727402 RepID=A0AAW2X4F5_9LAMI
MKMRLMRLLLQLLLAFAFTHQVHSQSPPGFISLDCGLRAINGYNDAITGLYYSTDGAYIETGEGRSISPEFQTNSVPRQFLNLRSFPGPSGTRNCYTFMPLYGKLKKILLRVAFMYGNYDDQRTVPQFDLYLGVDIWETVTFKDSSSFFITEIIHKPTSDYVHVCLVNTGLGTPFISVIELRPIDPPSPSAYNASSGSLKFFARWDLGSTSNNFVRYYCKFPMAG